MRKRPRREHKLIGEVIIDELAFIENKASKYARKIIDRSEQLHIEIWYDKHYLNRVQHGGDDGTKRDGINEGIVQDIVTRAIPHLFYYCLKVKGFIFINFGGSPRVPRILLQEDTNNTTLNVVIEVHYLSDNRYEITVITALVVDDFRQSDGQYTILMNSNDSILYKFDNKNLVQVSSK